MPRKGHISKREKMPDPKYNDLLVQRLVNCVMLDGKKSIATRIVYGAFDYIGEKT
jgi:small subunit ribosomal protein S7